MRWDVIVAGAGTAGLTAAVRAAQSGRKVLVLAVGAGATHLSPVTIDVPNNQGILLQSSRGVVFAGVDISWWTSQIHNLETKADSTHLAVFLSDARCRAAFTKPADLSCPAFRGALAVDVAWPAAAGAAAEAATVPGSPSDCASSALWLAEKAAAAESACCFACQRSSCF